MLSRSQIELAFRGYNVHLSLAKKGQIADDIIKFAMKQESTRDKDYYRAVMEAMEDFLDDLEKYIEKGGEGIEKLTKSLQEADVLLESFQGLREEMKESWRNAEE